MDGDFESNCQMIKHKISAIAKVGVSHDYRKNNSLIAFNIQIYFIENYFFKKVF